MKTLLTDLSLKKLTSNGQTNFFCTLTKNFGVTVSYGGTKTFFCLIGPAEKRKKISLGQYPKISLKAARQKAQKLLNASSGTSDTKTLQEALADYLELYVRPKYKPNTAYKTERLLKGKTAHLEKRYLTTLTTKDFHLIFDRLPPSQANHVFGAYQTFFRWCERREYCTNPIAKLNKPAKEKSRDRVLTDAELKAIWHACEDDSFGKIVRMLIATGQRRGEIAALESGWINETPPDGGASRNSYLGVGTSYSITFPPHITKNGNEHSIPLSTSAHRILAPSQPTSIHLSEMKSNSSLYPPTLAFSSPNSSLIFPSEKTGLVIIGFQKMKRELDKRSGVTAWCLHDIRRTFATRLADLGVLPHIIERMLNHTTGSISPLARRYNRASYLQEMKAAYDLWDTHISHLIAAP